MSVYFLTQAMIDRLRCFFMAESHFTQTALAGDDEVKVDTTEHFGIQALRKDFKDCLIWDNTTKGRLISTGYEGADANIIKGVSNNKIFLENPLTRDFLLTNEPIVIRAPGGTRIRSITLGDIRVELKYPAIIIEPKGKTIEFTTFSGTTETVTIDFIVYVKDDKTQDSTRTLLKVVDTLEFILMTNLHIAPANSTYAFEVTSKAHVKTIDYGVIAKGSEFVKAARLSWQADMYFWRSYFSAQNSSLSDVSLDFGTLARKEGCE